MDIIREWAFSICAAAIAVGILTVIMPESSMNKLIKTVVGVFFVIVIFSPVKVLLNGIDSIDIFSVESEVLYEDAIELTNKILNEQAAIQMESLLINELTGLGIENAHFQIFINTTKEFSIHITKIVLTLNEMYKSRESEVYFRLKDELELPVEIIYSRERLDDSGN